MKKYSNEEKTRFIERWERSGISKWAYCRDNDLNFQTLLNWMKKKTDQEGNLRASRSEEDTGFIEVGNKLARHSLASVKELVAEKDGIRIRLPAEATRADLAMVVQVLRNEA
jgi:transposase-like protein